jgi:hypothetical protein
VRTRAAIISVLLTASVSTACWMDDVTGPRAWVALSVVSGHDQIGHVGEVLGEDIVVRVADGSGDPVAGVALVFSVVEGGGTVHEPSDSTDEHGYARVRWTIGDGLFQTMMVWAVDERFDPPPATVSARTDRWVHLSILSGNDQTGVQGEQLPSPFVLELTDIYGDPVPAVDVHFEITAGGGQLDQTVARTNEEGLVEVRSTLGTGAYQRIKASITHGYWFAKYVFTYAETQFVTSTTGARWITGITFHTPYAPGGTIAHDGRILESAHFLVFSDGSSDEVRQQYANMAEESLAELLEAFDISSAEELGIHSDRPETKITIYCSAAQEVLMHAFPYGFVLYDISHRAWESSWAPMFRMNYRNTVKHELMHVLQFFLDAGVTGPLGEAWFVEGIAEYVSGGAYYHIESWQQVRDWRSDELHVNPLTIVRYWDEMPGGVDPGKYYPMFGLAVEYLLDAKGEGRSLLDVKSMLTEMGQGSSFRSAFQAHMGISVESYQARFYDLIEGFLAIY